jgi:hypothetical protein
MSSISGITGASSAAQYAQLGISRGISNVARDEQAVAGGADPTAPLVDASQQKLNVEANAKALQIADQTLGTLINVVA